MIRVGFGILLSIFVLLPAESYAQAPIPFAVDLGGMGFDLEVDELRGLIYVSLPDANEVVFISTQTLAIVDRVVVGARPLGIDLSLDGTRLFVALNQAGSVAVLDLETKALETISVASALTNPLTFDVLEASPDRVFVTASPGSGGFARVAVIMIDMANRTMTVASNQIIRARPTLAVSPDGASVYVGEGFSPNSLDRLDNTRVDAPIVQSAPFGSVSGTNQIELSPDGSQLYLASGQVLDPIALTRVGAVGAGIPRFGASRDFVFVLSSPSFGSTSSSGTLRTFETTTFSQIGETPFSCMLDRFSGFVDFETFSDASTFVALASTQLCGLIDPTVADLDRDDDGKIDPLDNCPDDANADQSDADFDGLGDVCDAFPLDADNLGACLADRSNLQRTNGALQVENQMLRASLADDDGDGVANVADQCPATTQGSVVDAGGCSRQQVCAGVEIDGLKGITACLVQGFAGSRRRACELDLVARPRLSLVCSAR